MPEGAAKENLEIIRDGKKERKYSSNVQEKGRLYGRYSERVSVDTVRYIHGTVPGNKKQGRT